jgi:hypothetical protein
MSNQKVDFLHMRINPKVKKEFRVVAKLRGTNVAELISQWMVAETRKEKRKDPEAFKAILETIQPESNQ